MATYGPCGQIIVEGAGFATRFASTAITLGSGQSSTFITLTPPSGQKVRLTALQLSANSETNISVDIGSETVITTKTLVATTPNAANQFFIGQLGSSSRSGTYLWLTGKVDEVITVTKTSGSTANTVQYAYEFGE